MTDSTDQTEQNRHRLNRASDALSAWVCYEAIGGRDPKEWVQLRDLLADLMHYASVKGIDFDHELSMATDFFSDETT